MKACYLVEEAIKEGASALILCRVGADDAQKAAKNEQGMVRGVQGLRVCDTSLIPRIPPANINTLRL